MTPLRVRARLVNGYIIKDPWSPAIDGIIAAAAMRERLGEAFYAPNPTDLAPVEGLPIEVVHHGDLWWYAASSPLPIGLHGQDRRYYHRRFDDQLEEYLPPNIGKVLTSAGPYKNTRLSVQRRVCRGLEWHVVGDAGEIERVLRGVDQIGGRRAAGFGEVSEWLVTPDGDADQARLRRPLPVDYARAHGVEGMEILAGIRPPAWLPANGALCIAPAGA